jgi:hypothetical protein
MRIAVWAVLMLGLSVATAGAGPPVGSQAPAPAQGSMDGMDMGPNVNHPKPADAGAGMDMGHCGGMGHCMDSKTMAVSQDENLPPLAAGVLRVTYGGKLSDWTPAALAALPHKTLTVHNEHAKADQTYSGVALIDLLTQLGVPAQPHGKDLALYLVAIGSDGYKAVYSVAEVNPGVHDATVIVADSEDGKPLTADGPFKLVATGEKRPARWVRGLVGVRVFAAQ